MPEDVTYKKKEQFVQDVIRILELEPIAGAVVGPPGAGLSFEELKRVTIGCEVVANPSLIFFDEPTTGLDGRAALMVVRVMRKLAHTGRAIICKILLCLLCGDASPLCAWPFSLPRRTFLFDQTHPSPLPPLFPPPLLSTRHDPSTFPRDLQLLRLLVAAETGRTNSFLRAFGFGGSAPQGLLPLNSWHSSFAAWGESSHLVS